MTIDLHGHATPLAYVNALLPRADYPRARAIPDGYRVEVADGGAYLATPHHLDLSLRIPMLRAEGVTVQALSLSSPYGFELLAGGEAVDVADAANAALREAAKPFGEQFVTLASAPVEASGAGVEVLRRALAAGHRGMILSSSVVVGLPHDEWLAPLLREVAGAGGVVLVHPGARPDRRGLPDFPYALNTAGFQNELTVALFRLVFGGLLDATPGLQLVFVNLGGAAPLMAERMRGMWENRGAEGDPPDNGFRRVSYDFSSFGARSLEAAAAILGANRLVFGSDFPIQGLERPGRVLAAARLSDADRAAIRERNAAETLGLNPCA